MYYWSKRWENLQGCVHMYNMYKCEQVVKLEQCISRVIFFNNSNKVASVLFPLCPYTMLLISPYFFQTWTRFAIKLLQKDGDLS